jgi:hypothetical protein
VVATFSVTEPVTMIPPVRPLWMIRGGVPTSAPAASVVVRVLVATGPRASSAPPVNVPWASASAGPSAGSAAPATPACQTSERGNVVKKVGETAAFGLTQDEFVVSFVIDKIMVGAKCTSQFAQKPEHGSFLRLDVRAETKPNMPTNNFDQPVRLFHGRR